MQELTTHLRSVTQQVSEFAKKLPYHVALELRGQQLSYEELDCRASSFAGYLKQHGISSGDIVAICMERSFEWIVAALGSMYAGAAYVPLDLAWPISRLRFAVNDCGATALVARQELQSRIQAEAYGVDPWRDRHSISASSGLDCIPVPSESLAYVIYTSGSSGVPKGVELTHANLINLIEWHRKAFDVTPGDRASHLAGLGFDAAVWEVWPNLCAGATVCLADDEVRSSPELIRQWMIRERISIGFVPTVHAAPLMTMSWPDTTALRFLLAGGEKLHIAPPVHLPFEVVNNYGPTECTVVATSCVLKPGSDDVPPIGRPITGASVYLLNEFGEPVPNGGIGEIYVGGSGVGRGYRSLPDLSALSFMPDKFSRLPGARMYRTGDRGFRRLDGEIEFFGRLDRQTKIRGQRVELDEIGTVLGRYPSIDFAAVIANSYEGGKCELVAYILPKDNARVPNVSELQNHLLHSLPEYMVPTVFVRLHALPLSPNGKIDLTRLPIPTDADLLKRIDAKQAASPVQEKLLAMVKELLETDQVGAEDNFFLAGGHSLLGMQLVMRVRDAFAVNLTLQQLFQALTVEHLARLVETKLCEERLILIWADILGRKDIGLDDNFFDLGGHPTIIAKLRERIGNDFGQEISIEKLADGPTVRLQAQSLLQMGTPGPSLQDGVLSLQPNGVRSRIFWTHYLNGSLANAIGEDQPFISVVHTSEDFPSLGETPHLQAMAACLVRKIVGAQSSGPYIIGGYCAGGVLAYEVASQLRAAGHEISLLVLLDAQNPSYLQPINSLTQWLRQLSYLLKRVSRLGLRKSSVKIRELLLKRLARKANRRTDSSDISIAQDMLIPAVGAYKPGKYEGNVLLIMASDHLPSVDLLPGWQAVVLDGLHTHYVDGHRDELIRGRSVQSVADIIVSHLESMRNEECADRCAGLPGSSGSNSVGESSRCTVPDKEFGLRSLTNDVKVVDRLSDEWIESR